MSGYLDRYARERTWCHRLPGGVKLALTLASILIALCIPLEHWPLLILMLVINYFTMTLANIPLRYLLRRLALFLPMMVLLTISLPASQGFVRGWDLMGTILLRSTVSLTSVLWLVNVLPFDELLVTLRRAKIPTVFLATLSFMYRFQFVLWNELERMQTARRMRSYGRRDLRFRWKSLTRMLGMLFVRGLSRAERVHGAMSARGWRGEMVYLELPQSEAEPDS